MIETYFSRTSTINRLRGGPLGPDLDDLVTALQRQGYAWDSIRHYLRGCDQFARWLLQQGYAIADVNRVYWKKGGKSCRLLLLMLPARFWSFDDLQGVAKLLLVWGKGGSIILTGEHPFDQLIPAPRLEISS